VSGGSEALHLGVQGDHGVGHGIAGVVGVEATKDEAGGTSGDQTG
jgi:hypothetical protein